MMFHGLLKKLVVTMYNSMEYITALNTSKLFTGVTLILMNFGSRYVVSDISATQEIIMSSPAFKKLVLFCMFFVGTHDIILSAILAFAFTVIVDILMNEKRRFNLIPSTLIKKTFTPKGTVSELQYKDALRIVRVYEEALQENVDKTTVAESKASIYMQAMMEENMGIDK